MSSQMSNDNSNKIKIKFLIFFCICWAIISPFLDLSAFFLLLTTIIAFIFAICLINNKIGLFLLIIARPCLDIFSNQAVFKIDNIAINLAAILGIFSILFAILIFLKNYKKRFPLILFLWGIFLTIGFYSITYSSNPIISLIESIRILSIVSLFISGYYLINTPKDLSLLIKIILVSAIIPVLFAFYQFFTQTGMTLPLESIYNRIYGTFAHPNLFAYFLIIPIALSTLIFATGDKRRVPNLLILLLLLACIFLLPLTYTRGAWLAFLIMVGIVSVFRFRVLLIPIIIALPILYFSVESIQIRVNDLIEHGPNSTVQWRIDLWNDSKILIEEKPIAGHGMGTSHEAILNIRGKEKGSPDPHNDYLKILIETGIIGSIAYFIIILTLLITALRNYFIIKLPKLKALTLIILGLSIAIYTLSFADNMIRNTALQWTFWVLIGAYLSVANRIKKQNTVILERNEVK